MNDNPGTGFAATFKSPDPAQRWWGKLGRGVTVEPEPLSFKVRAYLIHIGYGLSSVKGIINNHPWQTEAPPDAYSIVDRGDGPWRVGVTRLSRRPAVLYLNAYQHGADDDCWVMEVQGADVMARMAALALDISRRFHVRINVKLISTEAVQAYYEPPRR